MPITGEWHEIVRKRQEAEDARVRHQIRNRKFEPEVEDEED